MVIPRSRSALSLSSTQAYLKEPLPSSAASFSNFSMAAAVRTVSTPGYQAKGLAKLTSAIDATALKTEATVSPETTQNGPAKS